MLFWKRKKHAWMIEYDKNGIRYKVIIKDPDKASVFYTLAKKKYTNVLLYEIYIIEKKK